MNQSQKHLNCYKINRKSNKQWIDKSGEFNSRTIEVIFKNSDMEMCSTRKKRKIVDREKSIRTLRNGIYKYMNAKVKNICFDKLKNILSTIIAPFILKYK